MYMKRNRKEGAVKGVGNNKCVSNYSKQKERIFIQIMET